MSVPPRRPRPAPAIALGLGLALAVAGCDQPTGSTRPRPRATTPTPEVAEQPRPPAPEPPPAPVAPRPILGEKTQDIRDMEKEKKAGGVVASTRIVAKDPITLPGNAYVSIIGRASMGNIKKAVDLYQAETGEYPKSYAEFMDKIIKPNNIVLPKLPFYQEYSYDAATHSLVVLEYPERKEQANYPK